MQKNIILGVKVAINDDFCQDTVLYKTGVVLRLQKIDIRVFYRRLRLEPPGGDGGGVAWRRGSE